MEGKMRKHMVWFVCLIIGVSTVLLVHDAAGQDSGELKQQLRQLAQRAKQLRSEGCNLSELRPVYAKLQRAHRDNDWEKVEHLLQEANELLDKIEQSKKKKEEKPLEKEREKESPAPPLPAGLSPEHRQAYLDMDKWLNEKLVEWKPKEYKPIHFIGFHLPLSVGVREQTNSDDDMKFLDMLLETGADIISVGITGNPEDLDKSLIDRYDKVFKEVRNKNKKLKIWFRSFIYSAKKKPQKVLDATEYIIRRWHPDYYVITHEPKCESKEAMEYLKQWVGKACKLAKSIDPKVKTSVTAINYRKRLDCINYFVEIPELDIIGFDIYNTWGLGEDRPGGNAIEEKIKLIHSKGKESWIEEFWLTTQWNKATPDPEDLCPGFNDPNRASWDSRFLRVMTYFAQKNNLLGIEPWFTSHFLTYPGHDEIWEFEGKKKTTTKRYLKDIRNALAEGKRTPAFYEFQKLIEEFGKDNNIKKKALERLSRVKVASLYENITDRVRNVNETIRLLKETHTDFIFRGFWRWSPCLESPDDIPPELLELARGENVTPRRISEAVRKSGKHYEGLKKTIATIKKELPDILFCSAIPAQRVCRIERNPITGKILGEEETWKMALDPQKWKVKRDGKPVTKEEFQKWFGVGHQWVEKDEDYDRRKVVAYFPDITNPDFQELLLSWAKKQIECGADAIWIDMLHTHARFLLQITGDPGHPAVRDSFAGASRIVAEIHKYGKSKGKYIYVGSWASPFSIVEDLPYSPPKLDFVTTSPSIQEMRDKKLDKAKQGRRIPNWDIRIPNWERRIANARKAFGDIPIFAFIDWSHDKSPLVTFSQELDSEEQGKMLKTCDKFFGEMGANFVYPIHGGWLGKKAKKLPFGKYRTYDSLAPEFQTYETIKELAQKKTLEDSNKAKTDKQSHP
jgi:hypothetical protein